MKIDNKKIEQIAKVCHAANRAFCNTIGDHTQKDWEAAEQWQRDASIDGVKFAYEKFERGETPTSGTQHDSWMAEKLHAGWAYGPAKDSVKKEHPFLVPYSELPPNERLKDHLFVAIVKAFHDAQNE